MSKISIVLCFFMMMFAVLAENIATPVFVGGEFTLSACGWDIKGNRSIGNNDMEIHITAINRKGQSSEISIDFPEMGRNNVSRYQLNPAQKLLEINYHVPMKKPGNPRNVYQLMVTVKADSGETVMLPVRLPGNRSDGINLGTPLNSRNISASKFGTCVHFNYGKKDAFKGWRPYEELLNNIAECGYKWIRDGGGTEKNVDGNLKISEYDLRWIKAAKDRGISTILVISMSADEELPVFLQRVDVLVRGTEGLVNVYELGNEPNNFGNWIKKHGGTWNGREKDNSTSPWVKAHLQYTNAAADLIRKISPNAVVLGTGACAPTNYRYLDLGLSNNVDGLVEHPYSFALPPEKVPFGLALETRDGVKIGDKEHTFAGLIKSYIEKSKATGKEREVWVTEFGFSSFWFNGKNEKTLYAGYSEDAQAVYSVRRMLESLSLPIAVSCQYDFIDDYNSRSDDAESNFGIIRGDYSRKPVFYAVQRVNSLLHGAETDKQAEIKVTADPLHRACQRSELIKNWDDVGIKANNGIKALPFVDPKLPNERMLAVWSVLPFSGEFNNRVCSLNISGWNEFFGTPVAIDLITGRSYDIPVKFDGKSIVLDNLVLKGNPIVIKFFRD